jgi:DNA-binding PadR family transcriptional regulator
LAVLAELDSERYGYTLRTMAGGGQRNKRFYRLSRDGKAVLQYWPRNGLQSAGRWKEFLKTQFRKKRFESTAALNPVLGRTIWN